MPRAARKKSYDAIYHIMARSISEVDLFKSVEDKLKYISIIKYYQKLYQFRVYAYCLMDNHVHIIIDANGADISSIMHSINFKYAQYFNRFHHRHGHLFQDRFKSKIVKNERYLLTLSAYIHNNPMDISEYAERPQDYIFSSFGIYLGLRQDPFELVEDGFIRHMFGEGLKVSRERYYNFVMRCNDIIKDTVEFKDEVTEYRSMRKLLVRDFSTEDVIEYLAEKMNVSKIMLHLKNSRKLVEAKALLCLILRSLCNAKCSDICRLIGNVTQSRVSNLCSIGLRLINENKQYENIINDFIACYS